MPINRNSTPSAVTTSWPRPTPTGSPAATSTSTRSCGPERVRCWRLPTRSSISRADFDPSVKNRAAMTERTPAENDASTDAATLLAIESIKQLKARYCRYLDTKDWAAWRTIFTDDFVSDTSASGGQGIVGAAEFVAYPRETLGKPSQPTVHQVHAPEIELLSETTARGVWALEDVVRLAPGV